MTSPRAPRLRRRRRVVAVGLAAGALVGAACAGGDELYQSLPSPDTTAPLTTTTSTVPVDLSGVVLAPAPGTPAVPLPDTPGHATLTGVVNGPDGPVAGGVVRVERLDGSGSSVDVPTGADGSWALSDLSGGRYRVRAWRAPSLAMVEPQVLFLDGDDRRELALVVNAYGATEVVAAVAPSPPPVGEPVNLVVRVAVRRVGADGVVRAVPQAGVDVRLAGSGRWLAPEPAPVLTDGEGRATFRLECRAPGPQPLLARLDQGAAFPLGLPDCVGDPLPPPAG